jgi:prepilin-type N-terminal cleavage/methylation domain-containing protein
MMNYRIFHYNKQKGFTLFELVIVLTITSIFFGISIASYNTYTNQKKLENEAHKLADLMELAKTKAGARDIALATGNCVVPNQGFGYEIRFNTSLRRYTFAVLCTNTIDLGVYVIDPSVDISITPNTITSLSFLAPNGNPTQSATITFNHPVLKKCIDIKVETLTGVIKQDDERTCP